MLTLLWSAFVLPLIATLAIFFFLKSRPQLAGVSATGAMLVSFGLSVAAAVQFFSAAPAVLQSSVSWMTLGDFSIEFGILINGLTLLMMLIVTGIGTLIFLYSMSYMEDDESYARYFASLSLFAFSMLGIVLSNNLIQIFIFWELVGLSSYLLVGFWFQKPAAVTAGKKAFMTTRVGDVGMMIGILMLFSFFYAQGQPTFNFLAIQEHLPSLAIAPAAMTAIALLIFMGVMGKSAQLPLHVWLPDAMEGPTPVSALIHAATMVAAGVFLLARLFFIFDASPDALHVIAWIGGLTAFMAGTIAIVQDDIKKILAYSTLSQLGYMVMALGLGSPEAGMFHLTTHAFFKALLFLGAGSFIHALHTQDIWKMPVKGGLFKQMPLTSWTFLIGTLALMGVPPLSGFFSKEEILSTAYSHSVPLFALSIITVFFTSFYMGRLFAAAFRASSRESHAHESGWKMGLPLVLLAAFSIVAGFFPIAHWLGTENAHAQGALFLKMLSTVVAAAGFFVALAIYRKAPVHAERTGVAKVLERKYFFDDFYDVVVIKLIQENIARLADLFERKIVARTVMAVANATRMIGDFLHSLQTGVIQFYALVFVIGITVILYAFVIWRAA